MGTFETRTELSKLCFPDTVIFSATGVQSGATDRMCREGMQKHLETLTLALRGCDDGLITITTSFSSPTLIENKKQDIPAKYLLEYKCKVVVRGMKKEYRDPILKVVTAIYSDKSLKSISYKCELSNYEEEKASLRGSLTRKSRKEAEDIAIGLSSSIKGIEKITYGDSGEKKKTTTIAGGYGDWYNETTPKATSVEDLIQVTIDDIMSQQIKVSDEITVVYVVD